MIKANTTIIVGEKTFHSGQTVSGLSKMDKKWMSEAGYITEIVDKKEVSGQQAKEAADGHL